MFEDKATGYLIFFHCSLAWKALLWLWRDQSIGLTGLYEAAHESRPGQRVTLEQNRFPNGESLKGYILKTTTPKMKLFKICMKFWICVTDAPVFFGTLCITKWKMSLVCLQVLHSVYLGSLICGRRINRN